MFFVCSEPATISLVAMLFLSLPLLNHISYRITSEVKSARALPPRFGLYTEGESTCFIVKRNSADEAAETVRPGCISHKETQYRPAKKSSSCSDLRSDREFAEPAFVLTIAAAGTIEAGFKR